MGELEKFSRKLYGEFSKYFKILIVRFISVFYEENCIKPNVLLQEFVALRYCKSGQDKKKRNIFNIIFLISLFQSSQKHYIFFFWFWFSSRFHFFSSNVTPCSFWMEIAQRYEIVLPLSIIRQGCLAMPT